MFARGYLVLMVVLGALVLARAEESAKLELAPKWKTGDIARYEIARTVVREVDGEVVRKFTVRTPAQVEVADVDDDGYILRWTQGTTVFDDPKFDDDLLYRAVCNIAKAIDIDLELDQGGSFIGVRNWKALRISSNKVQDVVYAQMAKSGTPKTTIESLRKVTDKIFATQESIEASFAGEATKLVFPFGAEYVLGKSFDFESEIPNVFGGAIPFPAKGEYMLKMLDKDADLVVITFKKTIDREEAAGVLKKWVEEVAKKEGKAPPTELPVIQLDEVLQYEIELSTGWVKTLTQTRTAKEGIRKQTETIIFTRKK